MQIYGELHSLAAQPSAEELSQVDHRLFETLQPNQSLDNTQFFELVMKTTRQVIEEGRMPVIVGGGRSFTSSLARTAYGIEIKPYHGYPETLRGEFTEVAGSTSQFNLQTILLMPDKEIIYGRIKARLEQGCSSALEELAAFEAKAQEGGYDLTKTAVFNSIGTREFYEALHGRKTTAQALEESILRTCNYADDQYYLFEELNRRLAESYPQNVIRIESAASQDRMNAIAGIVSKQSAPDQRFDSYA
jgi:tRNA A37 N6-isopentenylltransferase MiaA